VSAQEQEKTGVNKTLTEEELNKFLDTIPSTQPPPAPTTKKQPRK
jgi:hypothetical protein